MNLLIVGLQVLGKLTLERWLRSQTAFTLAMSTLRRTVGPLEHYSFE